MNLTSIAQGLPAAAPLVLAALTVVLVAGGLWWYFHRRAARSVPARLRRAADDMLAGVLIPNADTGQIHIEYVLLTRQGIVLVQVRDIAGHVFGSETMQDWTVLGEKRRFTFPNPLPALYDRTAAVRRLLPEVPVRGCVAFTAKAQFSKGFPPNTIMLDALVADLASGRTAGDAPPADRLQAAWARLREEAAAIGTGVQGR